MATFEELGRHKLPVDKQRIAANETALAYYADGTGNVLQAARGEQERVQPVLTKARPWELELNDDDDDSAEVSGEEMSREEPSELDGLQLNMESDFLGGAPIDLLDVEAALIPS
jgi:hypothetical protein